MSLLKLVEPDDTPLVSGAQVVDEVVALLADRIPRLTRDDPTLRHLVDLHAVLAVGRIGPRGS